MGDEQVLGGKERRWTSWAPQTKILYGAPHPNQTQFVFFVAILWRLQLCFEEDFYLNYFRLLSTLSLTPRSSSAVSSSNTSSGACVWPILCKSFNMFLNRIYWLLEGQTCWCTWYSRTPSQGQARISIPSTWSSWWRIQEHLQGTWSEEGLTKSRQL